jgi:hypothetical protein
MTTGGTCPRGPAGSQGCRPPVSRQRLILVLPLDVSDIAVLLIAILEEGRTVEVLMTIICLG